MSETDHPTLKLLPSAASGNCAGAHRADAPMPWSGRAACLAVRMGAHVTSLWIPGGLGLGAAVALGFARFAYSLLMPAMQRDLHWSYMQAGVPSTAMAAGYLLGSMLSTRVERALGIKQVFMGALVLTGASLLAMAAFRASAVLFLLRFVTGLLTRWVFIYGFSLAARAGAPLNRSTLFTAVYGAGAGLGMVLSGLLLPSVLESHWGWQGGWLMLGILSLIAAALAFPAVRRSPPGPPARALGASDSLRPLRPILVAYFAYGAGYFALMTFVIVYLRDAGYGQARIVDFWVTTGLAVSLSVFVWAPLLARLRGGWGVALTTGQLIAGALVLLSLRGETALYLSAVLLGGSLMVSALAHLDYARELVSPAGWTPVIAAMTVMFSLGQALGPALCGWVSDHGGLRSGMFAAIGLLLLCIAAASLQRGTRQGQRMR